ncbi:MAG: hypothetical protein JWM98_730 [Thermoleophilia bacterium]|nr:hypothetical protein [Thermoleophilia bacterium]
MTALSATPPPNLLPPATPGANLVSPAPAPATTAPDARAGSAPATDALSPIISRAQAAEDVITDKLGQANTRRDRLTQQLASGTGDRAAISRALDGENALVKFLTREQEKQQAIQALARAVRLGLVPVALIRRMAELGMASIVSDVLQMAFGTGKQLSKEQVREIRGLGAVGVHVSMVDERYTFDGLRDDEQQRIYVRGENLEGVPTDPRGRPIDPTTGLPGQFARAASAASPALRATR